MRIFLEPNEPLLFRTGRPFDAGESGYAETLFPPTPDTIQGAIRAAIACHWDQSKTLEEIFAQPEVLDLIGDRQGYGRFRLTGLALGRRTTGNSIERLFPPPAHLLQLVDQGGKSQIYLVPEQRANLTSDLPDHSFYLFPHPAPDSKLEPLRGWLTESGLSKILRARAELASGEFVPAYEIYRHEPRLGIGMQNATKTTREGLLYQTQMIRMMPGYGFVADLRLSKTAEQDDRSAPEELLDDQQTQSMLRLPPQGWVTLGGDRRAARFEIIPQEQAVQTDALNGQAAGNLLYLATPAALEGGWQPLEWPASARPPITAAIQRYQSIGGWSMNLHNSDGTNKVMRRCVPAGSVYFFDQPIRLTRPLTDFGMEIGYGITYTGEW